MSFSLRSSPYTEHNERKRVKPPIPLGTRVIYTGTEYSLRTGTEATLTSYGVAECIKHGKRRGGGSYVLEFGDGWKGLATADEFTVLPGT